jgi:hypothetical protein
VDFFFGFQPEQLPFQTLDFYVHLNTRHVRCTLRMGATGTQ